MPGCSGSPLGSLPGREDVTDVKVELFMKPEDPKYADQISRKIVITNVGNVTIPPDYIRGNTYLKIRGVKYWGEGIQVGSAVHPGQTAMLDWWAIPRTHGGKVTAGSYTLGVGIATIPGETNTTNNTDIISFTIE